MVGKGDSEAKFLKAHGFGKDEALWITQYDSFPVRGGFLSPYMIVGRDPPTNPFCGKHGSYLRCDLTSLHGSVGGEDFYHNNVANCHSYRCHICWKYGWCVIRANVIESRFLTAEKRLGLSVKNVEHISASVPKSLYDLSPQEMSKQAILALKRSGVVGGVNILHPFRMDLAQRELVKGFHYHVLAHIEGGYDRCRECEKNINGFCTDLSCDGYEAGTRRAYENDGWIVSLAKNREGIVEKRGSVYGTAWYQCEHSGYKVGVKRSRIVEWFGSVGRRKFKTLKSPCIIKCGVCQSEMKREFLPAGVKLVANRGERGFMKNFTLPHVDGVARVDLG